MFIEESVLKALIKASKSLYYDRSSKSLIFLSRDRDQIYLIQKDPESEKTFEYMHDLEALDVKDFAKNVREMNAHHQTPNLWDIVKATIRTDEPTTDFKSKLRQLVINTTNTFDSETAGEIMAFLPLVDFLRVFEEVKHVYGSYSKRDLVVFRFPNTKDTGFKAFTFRAKVDGGFITVMCSHTERGMVEWR